MPTPASTHDTIAAIDQCLPQTQCTQCDYPNCREYACAIATGKVAINQCPPGGNATIDALSRLLECAPLPLNPIHGEYQPLSIAFIEEDGCIGCTLCIAACPVDCIIGAGKQMHTVIAGECTGCKLCLPACPTDCIVLRDPPPNSGAVEPSLWFDFSRQQVEKARRRTREKCERQAQRDRVRLQRHGRRRHSLLQQEILAAVKRKNANPSVPEPRSGRH